MLQSRDRRERHLLHDPRLAIGVFCQSEGLMRLNLHAASFGFILFACLVVTAPSQNIAPAAAQTKARASNMDLVGYSDLQARSAYQPVIQKQGSRWIAY